MSALSALDLKHQMYKPNFNMRETNKVKKECDLITQDNTIYKFSRYIFFSSIGQDNSKLQKQISKLLVLTATAA